MAAAPIPRNNEVVDQAHTSAVSRWEGTLLPSTGMYLPLWKSLLINLRDRFFPASLPALQLTSTPVNVLTPVGEILALPWYRTIFTSVGDVIAPETLPPLQLESRPVDVGELISDAMAQPWWKSLLRSIGEALAPEKLPPLMLESTPIDVGELIADVANRPWWTTVLRNIADVMSPESLPALQLSSLPVNPGVSSLGLILPHWSSLLPVPQAASVERPTAPQLAPNVHARDKKMIESPAPDSAPTSLPVPLESLQVDADSLFVVVSQFQTSLSHSRVREVIWVSAISLELLFLLGRYMGWI